MGKSWKGKNSWSKFKDNKDFQKKQKQKHGQKPRTENDDAPPQGVPFYGDEY